MLSLQKDAEKMYRMLKTIEPQCKESSMPSCLCEGIKMINNEVESVKSKTSVDELQPTQREKVENLGISCLIILISGL